MIVGTMLAAGLLAATAARTEESDTAMEATSAGQVAQPKRPAYGAYVNGDATTDADGVPLRGGVAQARRALAGWKIRLGREDGVDGTRLKRPSAPNPPRVNDEVIPPTS